MSAAEIAVGLSWPLAGVPTEGLPVSGGHITPVPQRLIVRTEQAEGERLLGESSHPSQRGDLVRVPLETNVKHFHIIGPTGSGKSTLLCNLILGDISAGRSSMVVEPRGDLIEDLLSRIPPQRRNDVVVIDPANNSKHVVGLNVLAGERDQAARRADELVHLLVEIHDGLGPRSTDILLHVALTASRLPEGTICDIVQLLVNPAFCRRALAQVGDPLVLSPWWAAFRALSDAERGQHVAPLLNKLRPFTSRDPLRRMLGQATPRFDLQELFSERRIVLVNLNRGLLGAPAANLLGALILSQVWSAIQRRAAVPPKQRHPVMMVVDEFQDYLKLSGGVDFGDALAQSRGLAVSWTLAHQHLGQLNRIQEAGVLANARSRVVFRPAAGDAKPLATAMGGGVTAEDLLQLRAYEACCQLLVDGQPTRPFSVRTRPLPPSCSDPDELRQASADRYGVDGDELDQTLIQRWQGGGEQPDAPVGVRPRRRS